LQQLAPSGPTRVLLVEDNPVDVRLIRFALREEKSWQTETTVANDGEKAIDYLLHQRETQGDFDLVILDLNLPKRDGTEVLQVIRSREELSSLPVIVLSSSPEDVSKAKVRNANVEANCYFTKPVGAKEFLDLGQRLWTCYKRAAGVAAGR
jgi:two-component system, chemotaxis family, response regulator Rcp1